MALKIYAEVGCTTEISGAGTDSVRSAVAVDATMTSERALWLKSDNVLLTYENVLLDALNDDDATTTSGEIDVTYALDSGGSAGTYGQTRTVPNGTFITPVKIWRKMVAPTVAEAFTLTNIDHVLTFDEYIA